MPTGFTTVTASLLQDSTGTPLTNATIHFLPVTNAGAPISFRAGSNGQVSAQRVQTNIVNGAFTIQLADTSETVPINVGYKVTIINNVSGDSLLGAGYGCVQPFGSTWSFDTFTPDVAAQITVVPGPDGAPGLGAVYFSKTLQFPSAGTQTVVHGMETFAPQIQGLINSGCLLYTAFPLDLNSTAISVLGPCSLSLTFYTATLPATAATVPVPTYDITTGLVNYWPMRDGSGQVFADSVGSSPLTAAGITWSGNVASFPGTPSANAKTGAYFAGSMSAISAISSASSPFTISFWLVLTAVPTSDQAVLISNTNIATPGFELIVNTSGQVEVAIISSVNSGNLIDVKTQANILTLGQKTHVLLTYDGSSKAAGLGLYLNGGSVPFTVAADALTGSITPQLPFSVGCIESAVGGSSLADSLDGQMDSLRLYTRVLAAADIAKLYASPVGATTQAADVTTGMTNYWTMKDGSGSSFADSVGSKSLKAVGIVWGSSGASFPGKTTADAGTGAYYTGALTDIPTISNAASPFTVSIWVTLAAVPTSNQAVIVSNTNVATPGFELIVNTSGQVEIAMINSVSGGNLINSKSQANILPIGQRAHVVLTYDGSSKAAGFSLYLNGAASSMAVAVDALSSSITPTLPFSVGCIESAAGGSSLADSFDGVLDSLRLYTRVLGSADIAKLYSGGY
ncbi:MAG: LamG domain-containing protein [Janthinobacterium lividum]